MVLLPEGEVIPEISLKFNGADVANKEVTLTSTENPADTYTATTGSAGGCTIKNIKTGVYSVKIGENTLSDNITVNSTNTSFEFTI